MSTVCSEGRPGSFLRAFALTVSAHLLCATIITRIQLLSDVNKTFFLGGRFLLSCFFLVGSFLIP